MRRSSRSALFVAVSLAAGSHAAAAQQWTCQAIRHGDSAANLASRMVGNAAYVHQPWFQILDPAASRFVAKARYDRLRPGWLACVLTGPTHTTQARVGTMVDVGLPGSGRLNFDWTPSGLEPDPRWFAVGFLLMVPLALYAGSRRWRGRRALVERMRQFGQAVIREFEQPLVDPRSPAPAVRSRLRMRPNRCRLEVLFAPAPGRTYPNLADHRKNVEYDVRRVLQLLTHEPFVSTSLQQRGEWVVMSFQTRVQKQEGAS